MSAEVIVVPFNPTPFELESPIDVVESLLGAICSQTSDGVA
jgi:hypothetical protein